MPASVGEEWSRQKGESHKGFEEGACLAYSGDSRRLEQLEQKMVRETKAEVEGARSYRA